MISKIRYTLRRLSVGAKLAFAFGMVLVLLGTITATGLVSLSSLTASNDNITQAAQAKVDAANSLALQVGNLSALQYQYILNDGAGRDEFESTREEVRNQVQALTQQATTDVQIALMRKMTSGMDAFNDIDKEVWDSIQSLKRTRATELATGPGRLAFGNLTHDADLFSQIAKQEQNLAIKDFSATASTASAVMIGVGLFAIALAGLFVFSITRTIRKPIVLIQEAAQKAADGDLSVSVEVTSGDEIGKLTHSFNEMVSSHRVLVERLHDEAERDSFGSQLIEAFEMADTQPEVLQIVERAMAVITSEMPVELLLSDSSKAHLEPSAENPIAGAPGCPVGSPFSCVAVRRGTHVVFESSESLNACAMLRDHVGHPCSAVCVPVTFMGRALGVLHATGPNNVAPDKDTVAKLNTLATQAGARIGTVRSFEKSQIQASTDGLTGLINRRTLESEVRSMQRHGTPFTIVMADLDHFKLLNDTYGHEAGDKALRTFSQLVKENAREGDLTARFGGEEFVLVFPETPMDKAIACLDRLRESLATTLASGDNPTFTASFGVTHSSEASTLEDMLKIADSALYEAKENGRNCIVVGDPDKVVAGNQANEHSPKVAKAKAVVPKWRQDSVEDDPFTFTRA